ncbi:MAG: hypothetical protein PWP04_1390 [Candidatus Atribacteria bacterium]|nr:hypothetical protein [Candidatus Atribacteria bacterium]
MIFARRGDWLSLIAVAVVLIALFLFRYFPSTSYLLVIESQGGMQEIEVTPTTNLNLTVSGPLGETLIAIQAGKAWVAHSPCPDKVCMEMGKIPDNGGFIACVPNQVVIRSK